MQASSISISPSKIKSGTLKVSGYKHAMVQVIAAAIAHNTQIVIKNAPLVDDTFILSSIINEAGGKSHIHDHSLFCDPSDMSDPKISEDLSKKIHGALYLMPAYISRFKEFYIGETGGCQIGESSENQSRPIDHMFRVMREFGVEISQMDRYWHGKVNDSKSKDVSINIFDFSQSSEALTGPHISGATKTAMLLVPLINKLDLQNPYFKTDVRDLLRFYQLLQHKISFEDKLLKIVPQSIQHDEHLPFLLTGCVSEVMTYFALAVHCGIELKILLDNVDSVKEGLKLELEILDAMGVPYKINEDSIEIYKANEIRAVNIDVTNDSIQSDHLPFFVLMFLKADSPSIVRDFVWQERFAYVSELKKLGAELELDGNKLTIYPSLLQKGNLTLKAYDTRSAAITILASLTASDPVTIHNLQHLHRGYEAFIPKLSSLNANIHLLKD